jgi:hypothetical protein
VRVTEPSWGWRLEEDQFGMLWLHHPNRRGERMTTFLVSAILKARWRLTGATAAERALLQAHGFGPGQVQ